MNIRFFNTIESPSGDIIPKIKYNKDKTKKAKEYLSAERSFFERLEIDEAKFEWQGDVLSYQHVFGIDDMVDRGELTEEEGKAKLLKDIPKMRALSQLLGQTMPAVSLIVRYKGTDKYYPLQFLMCDHIGWPKSEEIYLTEEEMNALIQGLRNAVDGVEEDIGDDTEGGGRKEIEDRMKDLVFRENSDKYDGLVIEVGHWCERADGSRFFSSQLDIDPINHEVRTDCGDTYMDYSISFDTFLAIADKIRELERR